MDWGTSNLRAWAMDADNTVIASATSDKGMGQLSPAEFEPALLELTEPWLSADKTTPVIACGMVGAKTGWVEANYRSVPTAPVSDDTTAPECRDTRHDVRIIGGLCQMDPADVMRGEETQLAGFLRSEPEFNGTICMPGTHTKWVRLRDGVVQYFRTVMTGELFALLSMQSVLRLTMAGDGWDEGAFLTAVSDMSAAPGGLTADLFGLRSGALLSGTTTSEGRSRLSGLLIGAELASMRDFWQDTDVRLLGSGTLNDMYAKALSAVGGASVALNGERLTLDGLTAAYMAQKGT